MHLYDEKFFPLDLVAVVSLIELICPAINILINSIQSAESKKNTYEYPFVSGKSY
jgi:hypothetical protein